MGEAAGKGVETASKNLSRNGTGKDYNEIIQLKGVLFARDGLDLTEQLTTMMNNEYAASLKK